MDTQRPIFGPVPDNRMPKQDAEKVLLMAEKFRLASAAHQPWAEQAKKNIEFLEGEQWTEEERAALEAKGRGALVFNKIAPLFRLVMGFQADNKTDVRYMPGHDGSGTQEVADILTRQFKQISEINQLPFEDQTVFADGLSTARGFWRHTLDFEDNDFGEVRIRSADPFSTYLDPDGSTYDLWDSCNYTQYTRWASYDEIEWSLGKKVAELVHPFTTGSTWNGFPMLHESASGEISAVRTFGETEDIGLGSVTDFRSLFHEHFIDTARKNIRVLETEYKITKQSNVFIDLETGDKKVIPDHWKADKIQKVLHYATSLGNPLVVKRRPVQRVRWVTMVGDVIAYDDWSPYERFSLTGFFPYFRRGKTRGMIEDLIDPQEEYNKGRITRHEIVDRTAKGGWKYSDKSLDPRQKANLERFGSTPGFNMEYKDGKEPPEQIQPGNIPPEYAKLEEAANADIREIAGINESALGQLDRVQSGRAIEARQRQAVLGLQMYKDNFSRSKDLQGRKVLNLVQRHYTEERVVRTIGEDGRMVQDMINSPNIDQMGRIIGKLNDVTIGKYAVVIDERPMSTTFASAQFEEILMIWDKLAPFAGAAMPVLSDMLVDMSTMPRKDEFKERLQQVLGIGATAMQPGAVPPGAAPAGALAPAALPAPPAE